MTAQPGPGPTKDRAAARLTPQARRVHQAILEAFVATGHPPEPAELDRISTAAGTSPAAAREELAAQDIVLFDASDHVRASYPFSPTPTGIRMTWPDGPQAFAMCAIDALGTSAMIGRPVTITATEPGSGVVVVEVEGTAAVWHPDTAVVVAGRSTDDCCGFTADASCGFINFFTTDGAAHAWTAAHPDIDCRILTCDDALVEAVAEFGDLLA